MEDSQFEDLYHRVAPRLVGVVYAMCGNLHEAEDCVHEAFVRAWTRRRSLDAEGSPEAWMRTTAVRLAVSRWRRRRGADRVRDRLGGPPDVGAPDADRIDVVRAMRTLKPSARAAVALHYLCDLPVDEVARITGQPVNTVKSHLARGRTALRSALQVSVNGSEVPR